MLSDKEKAPVGRVPKKNSIILSLAAALTLIPAALLILLNARQSDRTLSEIRFPASFTAYTGFTPSETRQLWLDMADREERFTKCELNPDDSLSLFVTPVQLKHNKQIWQDGLSGWLAQCLSRGVHITCSDDCRHMYCRVKTYEDYTRAQSEVRAALVALSCLQLCRLKNAEDSEYWGVSVHVYEEAQPDTETALIRVPA